MAHVVIWTASIVHIHYQGGWINALNSTVFFSFLADIHSWHFENKKSIEPNVKNKITIYKCTHCKSVLASASGQIITLQVICPNCKEPVEIKEPITSLEKHRTYGHDNLTIDQMHNNKKDALKAGHSHYFAGVPCVLGHIAPRTKRGDCNECVRAQQIRYKKDNPEKVRKSSRDSHLRNRLKKNRLASITSYGPMLPDGRIHCQGNTGHTLCGYNVTNQHPFFKPLEKDMNLQRAITCKRCLKVIKLYGLK